MRSLLASAFDIFVAIELQTLNLQTFSKSSENLQTFGKNLQKTFTNIRVHDSGTSGRSIAGFQWRYRMLPTTRPRTCVIMRSKMRSYKMLTCGPGTWWCGAH